MSKLSIYWILKCIFGGIDVGLQGYVEFSGTGLRVESL